MKANGGILKVLIIGANPGSLYNFRGELLKTLSKSNEVYSIASDATVEEIKVIEGLGTRYIDLPIRRNGLSPIADIKTFIHMYKTIKRLKPDVILAYTIKPIIWGGIASRLLKRNFFGLITGLGFAFQYGSFKRNLLRRLVVLLYRLALNNARGVIFQNKDNLNVFVENKIIKPDVCHLINGSGVDLAHFNNNPLSTSPNFLLIARLLGEKGVREYFNAASLVKDLYPNSQFHLVGPIDPSPDGVSITEVDKWTEKGIVKYHGASSDVRPFIQACNIFVLPSYHEGMPRTVLEAMATGRPILTTNVPGCKETVVDGLNGWLVEKGNVTQLAERMIWFIENPNEWQRMADASYQMVKDKFEVHEVNEKLLDIIGVKK